jgi:hypothetical protein
MKTAMQELIDELDNKIKSIENNEDVYFNYGIRKSIQIAFELLEKEKKQIQKAFSDGQETPINHPTLPHYSRDEYYDDNYNS